MVGDTPWQNILMDFLTDVPTTSEPSTILVVVDKFSKKWVLINLGTKTDTEVVACAFFKHIVYIHRLSYKIISDWDPQIVG